MRRGSAHAATPTLERKKKVARVLERSLVVGLGDQFTDGLRRKFWGATVVTRQWR
jgi:hypothetical protein